MVALVVADFLEIDGTPLEIAELVIEVPVDWTGVNDRHLADKRLLVQRLGFVEEIGVQGYVDTRVVDHALHPRGVAVLGQAFPRVAEVAVVIVETHGQALDDACRQFARIGLPLLGRVVLDERLIQRTADERNALVVEVGRVGAGEFARLFGDKRLGFSRGVVRVEELVDGAQVDRQREHFAVVRGVDAVDIVGEFGETVNIFPDARVGCVEQVGAVLVDFRARFFVHVRVCVAADMIAHVDDFHLRAMLFDRLLRHGQAEQACADDYQIRVHTYLSAVNRLLLGRCCIVRPVPHAGTIGFQSSPSCAYCRNRTDATGITGSSAAIQKPGDNAG